VSSEIDAFSLTHSLVRSVLLSPEDRNKGIVFKEQTQHVSSKFQLNQNWKLMFLVTEVQSQVST
jgi:hypothetical protein